MRHEDDRHALITQRPQHVKDHPHLGRVQAGGGFVQDQHLARDADRAGDGHDLLDGHRIAAQIAVHVDVQAIAGQRLARLGAHGAGVDQAEPAGFVPEHQVLRDRQVGQQVHLLIDGADAQFLRLQGGPRVDRGTVQRDRAPVAAIGAGQALDQRGFSRAVLAQQSVDLARRDVEVDIVQRARAWKHLGQRPDRQQHRHSFQGSGGPVLARPHGISSPDPCGDRIRPADRRPRCTAWIRSG